MIHRLHLKNKFFRIKRFERLDDRTKGMRGYDAGSNSESSRRTESDTGRGKKCHEHDVEREKHTGAARRISYRHAHERRDA